MSPRLRRRLAVALVSSLVSSPVGAIMAQPATGSASRANAAELKKKADALMDDGKFAEAYGVYASLYAVNADPALLYDEGNALKGMGDYPAALEKLEEFKRVAPREVRALVPALDELVADLRSRIATLVIRCNVARARVLVRDVSVGMTVDGTKQLQVRAGHARVEVDADGYKPFVKEIDLTGNETATVEATLAPETVLAVLVVRAVPEGSSVAVDDRPLGPAPVETKIAAGRHTIVVRHQDYVDETIPIELGAGARRELDITLRTPPPITARWWFWTGIGVAVVGGTIVAIALVSEKSPSSGTFSPGQVRAPLMAW